jgi:hypothetical protein
MQLKTASGAFLLRITFYTLIGLLSESTAKAIDLKTRSLFNQNRFSYGLGERVQ